MKFNGKTLILDNFRTELKDYTVDIQDVVRSAILDDIDITDYIDKCSPYKLDQIRLARKEGIKESFFSLNGEMLYNIRRMSKEGVDLKQLEKHLKSSLSEEHTKYVVQWVIDGLRFNNINVALIPKRLLESFDKGLRQGVDMSKYSKIQRILSPMYLDACIEIEKYGKSTDFLIGVQWNLDVVQYLQKNADLPKSKWKQIEDNISPYDSIDRVSLLVQMIRNDIDIAPLQAVKEGDGQKKEYVYDVECLDLLLRGYKENLDIKKLMKATSIEEMDSMFKELKLKKEIKVSGRLVKHIN